MKKTLLGITILLMTINFVNADSDMALWIKNNTGKAWILNNVVVNPAGSINGFCAPTMCYPAVTTGNAQGIFIPHYTDSGYYIMLNYNVCMSNNVTYDNTGKIASCADGYYENFTFNSSINNQQQGTGSQNNIVWERDIKTSNFNVGFK